MNAHRFIRTAAILTALLSASALRAQDLNWRMVAAPDPSFGGMSIAFDSTGRIYLGSVDAIFTSDDGGSTWNKTALAKGSVIHDIQVLPSGTIMAKGLRSSDRGATWKYVASGAFFGVRAHIGSAILSIGPTGTVSRSTDDAVTWTTIAQLGDRGFDLAADEQGRAYAVTGYGIYRSLDTGVTWELIRQSLASGLHISPTGSLLAYYQRIERSADGGSVWSYTPSYNRMYDMAAGRNGELFTAAIGYGVLRSTDDGVTWAQCDKELPNHNHYDVAVDPHGFVWVVGSDIWTNAPAASVHDLHTGATVIGQPIPMPAGDQVAVDVQSSGETTLSFTLVDLLGRVRLSLTDVRVNAGTHRQRIDLSALPPGRYMLRIDDGATQTFRPVVVVR